MISSMMCKVMNPYVEILLDQFGGFSVWRVDSQWSESPCGLIASAREWLVDKRK
jgi:hypothetical protein